MVFGSVGPLFIAKTMVGQKHWFLNVVVVGAALTKITKALER